MVEKVIVIKVKDGEVEQATKDIEGLGHSIEKVEDKSKKAAKETGKSFDKAGDSASNLKGGVEGVAQEVGNIGKAAKTSGAALKSALISTGIGALIVALGVVVANWEKIKNIIVGANDALEAQIQNAEDYIELLDDELDLLQQQKKLLEAQGKSTKEITEEIKRKTLEQIAYNKELITSLEIQLEQEKSQARQITFLERIKIEALRAINPAKAAALEAQSRLAANEQTLELEKRILELKKEGVSLETSLINKPKKPSSNNKVTPEQASFSFIDEEFLQKQLDQAEKITNDFLKRRENADAKTAQERLELQKQRAQDSLNQLVLDEQAQQQAQDALNAFFLQRQKELDNAVLLARENGELERRRKQEEFEISRIEDNDLRLEREIEFLEQERILEAQRLQIKVDSYAQGTIERINAENAFKDRILEIDQEITDKKDQARRQDLIQEQILSQQKLALIQDTTGQLVEILGKNSVAGKAAGIAQALINTYAGITEVLSNKTVLPEPFGTINKIASIATVAKTGFDAVKNITKTKLPAFASGGGGGQSGGDLQAPAFNVVGTSGVNQLAQTLQSQDQPIRAFVVGSDVTTQQEFDRNILDTATIG